VAKSAKPPGAPANGIPETPVDDLEEITSVIEATPHHKEVLARKPPSAQAAAKAAPASAKPEPAPVTTKVEAAPAKSAPRAEPVTAKSAPRAEPAPAKSTPVAEAAKSAPVAEAAKSAPVAEAAKSGKPMLAVTRVVPQRKGTMQLVDEGFESLLTSDAPPLVIGMPAALRSAPLAPAEPPAPEPTQAAEPAEQIEPPPETLPAPIPSRAAEQAAAEAAAAPAPEAPPSPAPAVRAPTPTPPAPRPAAEPVPPTMMQRGVTPPVEVVPATMGPRPNPTWATPSRALMAQRVAVLPGPGGIARVVPLEHLDSLPHGAIAAILVPLAAGDGEPLADLLRVRG
jgi:hypothetical protein